MCIVERDRAGAVETTGVGVGVIQYVHTVTFGGQSYVQVRRMLVRRLLTIGRHPGGSFSSHRSH